MIETKFNSSDILEANPRLRELYEEVGGLVNSLLNTVPLEIMRSMTGWEKTIRRYYLAALIAQNLSIPHPELNTFLEDSFGDFLQQMEREEIVTQDWLDRQQSYSQNIFDKALGAYPKLEKKIASIK